MHLFKYFSIVTFFRFFKNPREMDFGGSRFCVWRFNKEVQLLACRPSDKISIMPVLPCNAIAAVRALCMSKHSGQLVTALRLDQRNLLAKELDH